MEYIKEIFENLYEGVQNINLKSTLKTIRIHCDHYEKKPDKFNGKIATIKFIDKLLEIHNRKLNLIVNWYFNEKLPKMNYLKIVEGVISYQN